MYKNLTKCYPNQSTFTQDIQGVPESIDYFSRSDRGTPDEQKIIWEREVKNASLGIYGKNTGF